MTKNSNRAIITLTIIALGAIPVLFAAATNLVLSQRNLDTQPTTTTLHVVDISGRPTGGTIMLYDGRFAESRQIPFGQVPWNPCQQMRPTSGRMVTLNLEGSFELLGNYLTLLYDNRLFQPKMHRINLGANIAFAP